MAIQVLVPLPKKSNTIRCRTFLRGTGLESRNVPVHWTGILTGTKTIELKLLAFIPHSRILTGKTYGIYLRSGLVFCDGKKYEIQVVS